MTAHPGEPGEPGDAPRWHVYLVRRADGALYAGISTDVDRRLREHRAGGVRAARALRGRGPLELVYRACVGGRGTALRVERRLKSLGKQDKERLVREQPRAAGLLRRLAVESTP